MTSIDTATSRSLSQLESVLDQLRTNLHELGLTVSAWDAAGEAVGQWQAECGFCRTIGACWDGCPKAAKELADRVLTEGNLAKTNSACGCCVIGVPIYQRRRLIGAAVACYPTSEMLEEESLSRLCDRLHLDREIVQRRGRTACRHSAEEADDFLRVLNWMLKREQSIQVSREELTNLSTNLAATYEELSLLYRVSGTMGVTQKPEEFLQNVCCELLEVMNIEAAVGIVYAHPPAIPRDIITVAGQIDWADEQIRNLATVHITPNFTDKNCAILDNEFACTQNADLDREVSNLIAMPLMADGAPMGMLVGLNKLAGEFDSVDLKLINAVGNQAVVFLANNRLYADLQDLLMGVLHALTATIDAKDPYTCGHSQRVAMVSKRIAAECGLPASKVQRIYLCGLLHDIGKIGVPESTLRKSGKLTDEEYDYVKRHPEIGAKILSGIRQLDDVIAGILTHHERPDGRGYPQGLSREELPIEGLIVGLADCFDAMSSDRTYRKAMPLEAVIQEIRGHAGTQFDPDVVEKFLAMDLEKFCQELKKPPKVVFPAGGIQEHRS